MGGRATTRRSTTAEPAESSAVTPPRGLLERDVTLGATDAGAAVDAAELRADIARTRTVAGWGLVLWGLTPALDLTIALLIERSSPWPLLALRAASLVGLFVVWQYLRRARDLTRRRFLWIRAIMAGGAAAAVGLMAVLFRGLESSFLIGAGGILIVQGTSAPKPMLAALRGLVPTLLVCLVVMVVGTALRPATAPQLGSGTSWTVFAINVLTMSLACVLLAAGSSAYYTLRRQVFAQRLVGRYRLVERIGVGGMGEVWRARHPGLGHDIAVKILRTDRATQTLIDRFQAEIAALAELSHPHTVRILDSGVTDDGLCFYAMELLEGQTLAARLVDGPVDVATALEVTRQVAGALREAHGRGLVHRDLKPDNIFLVASGAGATTAPGVSYVKVLDFGIAKRLGDDLATAGGGSLGTGSGVVGTPAYMAPEQRVGAAVDGRADVYALGAVLHHMLLGRPPGDAEPSVAAAELASLRPPVAPAVIELVSGALAAAPSQRLPSMAEVERLAALAGGGGTSPLSIGNDDTHPLPAVVPVDQPGGTAAPRPSSERGRSGAGPVVAATAGGRGDSSADLEHRGNLIRTRAVLGWGACSWASTASIDLLTETTIGGVDFRYMLGVRAGVLAVLLAVWLRIRLGPTPSERALALLTRAAFAGAAVGLGLLSRGWDGFDGLMFGGMACVLIADGLATPGPFLALVRRLTGTLVAYVCAAITTVATTPALAPQLTSSVSWAVFAHYVILMALYVGLMAAAGDAYWNLRRQLFAQRLVGRYKLRRILGRGGMGEVWLAGQPGLDRDVAIKILHPGDMSASMVKRFESEVAALRELRHPNIVQVHDVGITDDGLRYYVMEYVAGVTVGQQVREHGPLPPGRALAIARQVAAALAEAHARGVVHRDLKPDNILLVPGPDLGTDHVKVIDFGIARRTDDDQKLTQTGTVLGTPAFMAPEQATGGTVEARSDLYALGAVLFFMLTGRPPFTAESLLALMQIQVRDPAPAPSTLAPALPPEVDALVLACLAKAVDDRPGSMIELASRLAALGPAVATLPPAPRPEAGAARPDVSDLPTVRG